MGRMPARQLPRLGPGRLPGNYLLSWLLVNLHVFTECPEYNRTSLANDDEHSSELKASYSMKKVKLSYGKLLFQEIELEQITGVRHISNDKQTIRWTEREFGNDGQSSEKDFSRLIRNAVYRPTIRIVRIVNEFQNNTYSQSEKYNGKVKTFL
jgi:hypothetical protein